MVKITKQPSRRGEFVRIGQSGNIKVVGRDEAIGTQPRPYATEVDDDVAAGGCEGREGRGEFEIRDVIEEAVTVPQARLDDVDEVEVKGVVAAAAFEDEDARGRATGQACEGALGD
jgi:hypothetical protein